MRASLLRPLGFALACLLPISTRAAVISAGGISLPVFDATGKLTHKVLAKRGSMTSTGQALQGVEVQLFSPTDPTVIVQTLEADDAVWDPKKQTLSGQGNIVVTAADNRLRGEGFDFSLLTSRLQIHRSFSLQNAELTLTSDRAMIDLVIEKENRDVKVRDVGRCEAEGNLVLRATPQSANKFKFDEAFSERAIYDGAARTVTFPGPVRSLLRDYEMTSQTMTISLDPPTKSLIPR